MGVIGDLKFIVGLGAIGAIGFGSYKIYKKISEIDGVKDVYNNVENVFNQTFEEIKDTSDYFQEAVKEDPLKGVEYVLTPAPLKDEFEKNDKIIDSFNEFVEEDPLKTAALAPTIAILGTIGLVDELVNDRNKMTLISGSDIDPSSYNPQIIDYFDMKENRIKKKDYLKPTAYTL